MNRKKMCRISLGVAETVQRGRERTLRLPARVSEAVPVSGRYPPPPPPLGLTISERRLTRERKGTAFLGKIRFRFIGARNGAPRGTAPGQGEADSERLNNGTR